MAQSKLHTTHIISGGLVWIRKTLKSQVLTRVVDIYNQAHDHCCKADKPLSVSDKLEAFYQEFLSLLFTVIILKIPKFPMFLAPAHLIQQSCPLCRI